MSITVATKDRAALDALVAEFKKPVKRDTSAKYRCTLPSGKLSGGTQVLKKVKYAKGAFRADRKSPGACPNHWGLPISESITKVATRDVVNAKNFWR